MVDHDLLIEDAQWREALSRALLFVAEQASGPALPHGCPVTLNFHPDALHEGRLTIEVLADEGVYRSQFETGTSNGGLTAHPGGDRWLWESRIFGAAYDEADPVMRPKYGALNYRRRATGASPRFGSCHLRLRSHVLARTTFCYPDSHLNPLHFGVSDNIDLIDLAESDRASMDILDNYIEAHVHGPLTLADDVEALVLDPSYRATHVEMVAGVLPCPIEWHGGFRMPIRYLPECAHYRGPEFAKLADALAVDGVVTPSDIGLALKSELADPQSLKRVWHCVAKFGSPEQD